MYLGILKDLDWPNPSLSSASETATTVTGKSGVKMTGPYEYVPPVYWLTDTQAGGAYGYNTETSPGPAIPPRESLERFIPKDHLWPIDDVWNFHAGRRALHHRQRFHRRPEPPLRRATSLDDYERKAQAMTYDGQRAMFEAYGRNKYTSTGVIQWMLNNAWPSLIWHLYDYYMVPAGGYFGTKKACEPVHVQYSYDDNSVAVMNSTYDTIKVRESHRQNLQPRRHREGRVKSNARPRSRQRHHRVRTRPSARRPQQNLFPPPPAPRPVRKTSQRQFLLALHESRCPRLEK